jgi:predicted permease
MTFWSLAQIILGFVAIVGVGWLLRRFGILKREDARPINNIIIYAGLPAMIFRAIHPAELDPQLAWIAAVAWIGFIVLALLAWGMTRLLSLPRIVAGGFILAAALGNTGYIGYPIAQAFLGDTGLVRAIFYDVFGTVSALLFVGLWIAQRMGSAEEERINILKEVLSFPAVLAVFAGLLLRPFPIPEVVSGGLDALATLVVPLIMISVGLSLRPGAIREYAVPLALVAGTRLIVAPLLALAAASLLLGDAEAVRLAVLSASTPTMMLTLVVGGRFGLDTDFIASAILVTTVASIVTIPLMQTLAAAM